MGYLASNAVEGNGNTHYPVPKKDFIKVSKSAREKGWELTGLLIYIYIYRYS